MDDINITENTKCPLCDAILNASFEVGPNSNQPRKDDISICAHCGGVLQFNEDLSYRPIDSNVWSNLKSDHLDSYKKVVEAVIAIKAKSQSMVEIRNYLKSI